MTNKIYKMNLSVNEKQNVNNEISPAGNLDGSVSEQHHQILKWHEKRLGILTSVVKTQEDSIKSLAEELVSLKAVVATLSN
jgi:hypothetical protein